MKQDRFFCEPLSLTSPSPSTSCLLKTVNHFVSRPCSILIPNCRLLYKNKTLTTSLQTKTPFYLHSYSQIHDILFFFLFSIYTQRPIFLYPSLPFSLPLFTPVYPSLPFSLLFSLPVFTRFFTLLYLLQINGKTYRII